MKDDIWFTNIKHDSPDLQTLQMLKNQLGQAIVTTKPHDLVDFSVTCSSVLHKHKQTFYFTYKEKPINTKNVLKLMNIRNISNNITFDIRYENMKMNGMVMEEVKNPDAILVVTVNK